MIELQGLRHRYPSGPEIHFCDISVPQGHTLVLRGDSGSGKSTLLSILAGLLPPTRGQVAVAGTDPWALGASARDTWRGRTVGLLPQRAWVNPALSVWQHLALPAVCTGEQPDHARIEQLLSGLNLSALADRPAHTLSGGQVQRLALGRALVRQPRVLLADEPTASLDDRHTGHVLQLLHQLAGQATVVIATHDARVHQHLSTRLDVHTLSLDEVPT